MANSIKSSNDGSLVAIASREMAKAQNFGTKHKINNVYDNYHDLLEDSSIDTIYIPVPNHLHKKWALKAIRHGKHVLCEKPFALNVTEAKEIFDEAFSAGKIVMEGFMFRFNPVVATLKHFLETNVIGKVSFLDFTFAHPIKKYLLNADNYRYYKKYGGGSLYDLGSYGIHLSTYLFNSQLDRVIE